jgi:uncharacterized protein (TIGR03067 family)
MRIVLSFVAVCCLVAADAAPDAVKKELALFDGEWTMVSGERDGMHLPDDLVKTAKRVAKDGETTVTIGGSTFLKAKYTVDPSKKPKTIDYTLTDGPNKGKKQLGIYEIDGDLVKICFASPDAERPTEFTTKADSGRTLSVWKRAATKRGKE